jgi:hypothetical protein
MSLLFNHRQINKKIVGLVKVMEGLDMARGPPVASRSFDFRWYALQIIHCHCIQIIMILLITGRKQHKIGKYGGDF